MKPKRLLVIRSWPRGKGDLTREVVQVVQLLSGLDIEWLWAGARATERWTLIEELLKGVDIHPDRRVERIAGAPLLNVDFSEIGLDKQQSKSVGVGGGSAPVG